MRTFALIYLYVLTYRNMRRWTLYTCMLVYVSKQRTPNKNTGAFPDMPLLPRCPPRKRVGHHGERP